MNDSPARRNIYISDPQARTILDNIPAKQKSEVLSLMLLASPLNTDARSQEVARRKLDALIYELTH